MKVSSLVVWLCLGLINNLSAQNSDSVKRELRQMAEKGNYGILYTRVGSSAVTTASSGFKGVYEIDLWSRQLDTVGNSPLLQDDAAQKSLMDLSQLLVKKGVQMRSDGDNGKAAICYRLPLYMVCRKNEKTGMDIISRNLWTAKEEMKYETTDGRVVDGLLKMDAAYLLDKYGKDWEGSVFDAGAPYELFLLYHRLADFAHNDALRKKILSKKLSSPGSMDVARLLTAVMEELAETGLEDVLADNHVSDNFKQTWNAFLKYRDDVPEQNVLFFRNLFNNSLRQFELLEIAAVSAGGTFGHDLSYSLSPYIQEIGRDIVYFDMLNKKPLDALLMSENIRAKSLAGWLARNHRNRLFTNQRLWGLSNINVSQPWLRAVVLDDIYDASKNSNSPILTFLRFRERYLAWLVTPEGKVFYGLCENVDSLCNLLYKRLPYNFQLPEKSGGIDIVSRGLYVSGENKVDLQKQVLKELYSQIIPSNIREALNNDKSGKLIIIPDGKLHYIPFDALINEQGKYLVQEKEIIYWPSVLSSMILSDAAAAFKYEEASAGRSGEPDIKIFGDPVFTGTYNTTVHGQVMAVNLPPLPGTAVEANSIAGMFGTKPLLQQEVKLSEFSGKMKYSILHLATHGYLNSEDPMRSFVALSDGPLYAGSLYNEQFIIKAKLVVLSACQTGLGSFTDDSPIGLNNSFLVGGANCTISSLWAVHDDATTQLMLAFYKNLKSGSSISRSLRDAQLSLIAQQKWEAPYYWAAFKATGIADNPLAK